MIIQETRAGVILSVVKNGPRITVQHVGLQGANGVGVPVGGTTGQVLSKSSNTDYATEWVNQPVVVTDHTLLSNIGTNTHSQIDAHISSTSNPHSVTKAQVGLSNVVNADTTTTANITDSLNKRFVTDAEKTVIGNTSGINTGDQDLSGKENVGVAASLVNAHATLTNNPHSVTKAQVGLANVDNTSDLDKPISTATQTALDLKLEASDIASKISSDPTGVTGADQVTNMISLTQAEYDAIGTKNPSTFYLITDAS